MQGIEVQDVEKERSRSEDHQPPGRACGQAFERREYPCPCAQRQQQESAEGGYLVRLSKLIAVRSDVY
jgi:hypothetical protein